MRIEDITKNRLLDATDLELMQLKYKFSKFWDRHFKKNTKDVVGCFSRIDFVAKYRLLLKECSTNRSLQNSTCDIDRQAFKQSMQAIADGIDLSAFTELTAEGNTVVLDANFAKADEISITIRAFDAEAFNQTLEEELTKIFKEQLGKDCVFSYDTESEYTAIPLFNQVLRPVSKIEKIEVKKPPREAEVEKNIELVPVEKGDEQIVYGIVYEPDTVDAQGDKASADEIKKAAYAYMENAQAFKVMHKGKKVKVKILENYIAPVDFTIAKRKVKKGSWVLVTRVLDKKLWQEIKAGNLTGYSMAGRAQVA